MTRPALVGFLFDLPGGDPKIFFRTMLYATGKRGHILEGFYLKVHHGKSLRTFSFWMYGDPKSLLIGSGLRISEDGVSANHHFLTPRDGPQFEFLPGEYVIEVWATVVNRQKPAHLQTLTFSLAPEHAIALRDNQNGILFTWRPESHHYRAEVSSTPAPALNHP